LRLQSIITLLLKQLNDITLTFYNLKITTMKLSRKTHAMLDYGSAVLLFIAPWIFNFADVPAARTLCIIAAILIIGMSLMTNYEASLVKLIPMKIHLMADVLLGLFFIASPWLLNFSDETYLFHVAMGIVALFAGVFTTRASLRTHYQTLHSKA